MDQRCRVHYSCRLRKPGSLLSLESSLKVLLGLLVSVVSGAAAFAVPILPSSVPRPSPAPDLAIGAPAMLAAIGAFVLARLLIRHRAGRRQPTA